MQQAIATIKIETWIAIISFLLGLGATFNGVIIWYANSEKKKYAAERDFSHLKNNYQQLTTNQNLILDELDDFKDAVMKELTEIKALVIRSYFDKHKDN